MPSIFDFFPLHDIKFNSFDEQRAELFKLSLNQRYRRTAQIEKFACLQES